MLQKHSRRSGFENLQTYGRMTRKLGFLVVLMYAYRMEGKPKAGAAPRKRPAAAATAAAAAVAKKKDPEDPPKRIRLAGKRAAAAAVQVNTGSAASSSSAGLPPWVAEMGLPTLWQDPGHAVRCCL